MFVPAIVQLSYAGLRSIMSKYGRNRIAGIIKELKVDKATARKINETYQKVEKKGDITQKLGKKNVVSNKNTISVRVDKPQADVLKGNPITSIGGTGQKTNLVGTTQSSAVGTANNRVTPGSLGYPKGETVTGKGLLTATKDAASATGRGLLSISSDPRVIGGGLLGGGIYAASGNEKTFDSETAVGTDRRLRDDKGNLIYEVFDNQGNSLGRQALNLSDEQIQQGFTAKTIGADSLSSPTMKQYNDFKGRIQAYENQRNRGGIIDRLTTNPLDDPENPINQAGNSQLAAIYQNDPENIYRQQVINRTRQNEQFATSEEAEAALNQRFGGQKRAMELVVNAEDLAQRDSARKGFDALAKAQANIQSGSALVGEQVTPRFGEMSGPNQFALIKGDDRNMFERSFNIGEPGVYVKKVYDDSTGTYKIPNSTDAGYQEFTESELSSGITTNNASNVMIQDPTTGMQSVANTNPQFNLGTEMLNAKGENIGTQGPITSTTIQTPSTPTGPAFDGIKDQPSIAGNVSDNAQIFGLVNYLSSLAQNNNTFLGQQTGFNTGFLSRPPMQQYYGSRRPGLFDKEFYGTRTGFF